LNNARGSGQVSSMMNRILSTILALVLTASAASATCYVDYKAKQDDPLRLHYGVAEIFEACTIEDAYAQLAVRLADNGWTLLIVLELFDEQGLAERIESAGEFYLRY